MKIIENALMKHYTSFKVGGPADRLIVAETRDELEDALQMPRPMILGNGSNVLFGDSGYRGTVIKLGGDFNKISVDGNVITAGAGASLISVSRIAYENGLSGLEFACGIPASVGGAVFMNAGAYDHSLSELLDSSEGFGYRKSPYMTNGEIVCEAKFNMRFKDRESIKAVMDDYTQQRTAKQPIRYPSAGSFFKRPEGHFAGKLIQDAGLKGYSIGGAQVSELHAGFIINTGGASAADILKLMQHVQQMVFDQFGVMLEPEVRIISE